MMHDIQNLTQQWGFPFGMMGYGFFGVIGLLAFLDLGLKGWGLWRAARMEKNIWFIALLLINSFGILPAIFLLITKEEYEKRFPSRRKNGRND